MSEQKAPYETEVADAMEMLGKGYEHESLEEKENHRRALVRAMRTLKQISLGRLTKLDMIYEASETLAAIRAMGVTWHG